MVRAIERDKSEIKCGAAASASARPLRDARARDLRSTGGLDSCAEGGRRDRLGPDGQTIGPWRIRSPAGDEVQLAAGHVGSTVEQLERRIYARFGERGLTKAARDSVPWSHRYRARRPNLVSVSAARR